MGTFTFQNICHLFSFHERMLNLCKYIKCSTLDFPHDMGVVNQCNGIYALVCWDISCSHLSTSLNTQRMTNNLPIDDTEYGLKIHVLSTLLYTDCRMSALASQITSLTIVYSTVYSDADQRKHLNSAPLAFVRGIHRRAVNSPHKGPVTREMFPFDDVIMAIEAELINYPWPSNV